MPEFEGDGSFPNHSSDLQAIVASGVVGDMLDPNHVRRAVFAYRNLATGGDRKVPDSNVKEILRLASPSTYIRNDAPPILLIHGAKDEVVAIHSTDAFVESMKEVKADITYLRYEDAGHTVIGHKSKETRPAMMAFFNKYL